jgi:nucleoside 2-deoxyribosyltransferase
MKVYVAAKFEAKNLVRQIYQILEGAGHTITHNWTHEDDTHCETFDERIAYQQRCAQSDLQGVRDADVLVLVPHPLGKGCYYEFGAAMALNIPVVILGDWADKALCIFERLVPPHRWVKHEDGWAEGLLTAIGFSHGL